MTVYFAASEVGAFTPTTGNEYERGSPVNASFSRACLYGRLGNYAESVPLTLPDEFWIHVDIGKYVGVSDFATVLNFRDGSTDVLRIQIDNDNLRVQALITAVWTTVGSAVVGDFQNDNSFETVDIHVVGNSGTGSITVYMAGAEATTGTADLTAVTGIDRIRLDSSGAGGVVFSQLIIADEPTIGWRLMTLVPSGNGSNMAWTGDYTSVDELQYNDADYMHSAAADQIETMTVTPVSVLSGYTVRAVGVYCRARRGGSGPQNIQLAVRTNGADYFSGTKALGLGFSSFGHVWDTNPDTAAAWLGSQVTALQVGVKSIA